MTTVARRPALEPVKAIRFEVGPRPNWEEASDGASAVESDEEDSEEDEKAKGGLRSVADSHIILQSLRQSRYIVLTSFFQKFSSRSRSKNAPEIHQPPHSLDFLGKCDLDFGPHSFIGTRFYQVNYIPQQHIYQPQWNYPQAPQVPQAPQTPQSSSAWANAATAYSQGHQQAPETPPSVPPISQAALPPGTPAHGVPITPELIAQVNTAATTDPELSQILYLAARGQATANQLHSLGTRIQSMNNRNAASATPVPEVQSRQGQANGEAAPVASEPPAPHPAVPANPVPYHSSYEVAAAQYAAHQRPPDIAFEFRENPTERWILPCDNAVLEKRLSPDDGSIEALLSTFVNDEGPRDVSDALGATKPATTEPPTVLPVTLHLINVPHNVWHALATCTNARSTPTSIDKNAVFEDLLKRASSRVYLRHRLPLGHLPADLDDAVTDKFAPKALVPRDRSFASGSGAARQAPAAREAKPTDETKKERKLAPTHWKDGTPRFCQACGRTETIAWRRGPNGPGTLCNPCASKFRGRPELFKMPEKPFTLEDILARQAAEAAEKPAEGSVPADPDATKQEPPQDVALPAPVTPAPAKSSRRKPSAKSQGEPWSAYSHRPLTNEPVPMLPPASAQPPVAQTAEGSSTGAAAREGSSSDAHYRYGAVWQDEQGASRYGHSSAPPAQGDHGTTQSSSRSRNRRPSERSDSRSRTTSRTASESYRAYDPYAYYDYTRGAYTHGQYGDPRAAQYQDGRSGAYPDYPAYSEQYPGNYDAAWQSYHEAYAAYYRDHVAPQDTRGQQHDPRHLRASYGDPRAWPYPQPAAHGHTQDRHYDGGAAYPRAYAYNEPYPPPSHVAPYQPYYSSPRQGDGESQPAEGGGVREGAAARQGSHHSNPEEERRAPDMEAAAGGNGAAAAQDRDDPMDGTGGGADPAPPTADRTSPKADEPDPVE